MAPRRVRSGRLSVTRSLCPIGLGGQYDRAVTPVFWASAAAWFALEAGLFFRDAAARVVDTGEDHGSGLILITAIGAAMVVAVQLSRRGGAPQFHGGAVFDAGIACIWAGVGLRAWAVLTLGRFFRLVVTVQEGHRVVRTGPYRVLRHPAYSGTMLSMIGLGLALDSWLGLAICVVVPLLGYVPRITVEEAALRDRLGPDYVEYSRTTRRLVPFVW